VVEGARLESVYTGNGIAGSNPALSAFARRSFSSGGFSYAVGFGGHGPPKVFVWTLAQSIKPWSLPRLFAFLQGLKFKLLQNFLVFHVTLFGISH
jgi:hypothetical protein